MQPDSANAVRRPWYREPYVWLLAAIPLSSVLMGMVMLWLALHNEDSLVVDDYYRQGLEINRVLERDDAARRYGLASELSFNVDAARIHVDLSAAAGFRYPTEVRLALYHATRSGVDQEIVLVRTGDHVYTGALRELIRGHWYVSLYADDWRLTGATTWPRKSSTLSLVHQPAT